MLPEIKPVTVSGITLKVKDDTVIISGHVGLSRPDKIMEPFFTELHNKVIKSSIKHVTVDLKKLIFLNSSGIREFVIWSQKLNELDEDKRYTILLKYNPEIGWQESCISSLVKLNPGFIKKEAV